jgi:hypothetical protein
MAMPLRFSAVLGLLLGVVSPQLRSAAVEPGIAIAPA